MQPRTVEVRGLKTGIAPANVKQAFAARYGAVEQMERMVHTGRTRMIVLRFASAASVEGL